MDMTNRRRFRDAFEGEPDDYADQGDAGSYDPPTPPTVDLTQILQSLLTAAGRQDPLNEAFAQRYLEIVQEIPILGRAMREASRSICTEAKSIGNAGVGENRDYDPVHRDFSAFPTLDIAVAIAEGAVRHYLLDLRDPLEHLANPRNQVHVPFDFSVISTGFFEQPTPLSSSSGQLKVGDLLKLAGLDKSLHRLDTHLKAHFFYPQARNYVDVALDALLEILSTDELGRSIVNAGQKLYRRTSETFKPGLWEVHESNPLLTRHAIDVYASIPHVKSHKKKRDVTAFDKLRMLRSLAQLSDPVYMGILTDPDQLAEQADETYKRTLKIARSLIEPLQDFVRRAYEIEGIGLPTDAIRKRYLVSVKDELKSLDWRAIGANAELKKKASSSERRIAAHDNEAVVYLADALVRLSKESYDERLKQAEALFEEIQRRGDKRENIATGRTIAVGSQPYDRYVIRGNVFSGARIEREATAEPVLEEIIERGSLFNAATIMKLRERGEKTAALGAYLAGNAVPGRALAIVAPNGSGKTRLLRAFAQRTNSMVIDYRDLSIWKYPAVNADIMDQVLGICRNFLGADRRPTTLFIDNFLDHNPEEQGFWESQASQLGETFASTADDPVKHAASLLSFLRAVEQYPLLRLVVATTEHSLFFQRLSEKEIPDIPPRLATVTRTLVDRIGTTALAAGTLYDQGQIPESRTLIKLDSPVVNTPQIALGSYFDVLLLGRISPKDAGYILKLELHKKLSTDPNIRWDTLFSDYSAGVSGRLIRDVSVGVMSYALEYLERYRRDAAQSISEFLETNGDSPQSRTVVKRRIRQHIPIDQGLLEGIIKTVFAEKRRLYELDVREADTLVTTYGASPDLRPGYQLVK